MMRNTPPYPRFPDSSALVRAFFEEGVRHLEDAHVLHEAGRYPAFIASAMKAAEFGVKAIIVLDGAIGWWDKMFTTHSPLGDINNLRVFEHHVLTLENYNKTLAADVMGMERLAPARPGGSYDIEVQKNPEYPFLSYQPTPASDPGVFRLDKPSTYFLEADSKRYYNTAQDLLTAVATQYAAIGSWGLALPAALP